MPYTQERGAHAVVSVKTVKETLRRLMAEIAHLDPGTITDASTLDEDIQLPSVAFVELQVAVEDMFGIELDPVEVVERNTFEAIAELIAAKIQVSAC